MARGKAKPAAEAQGADAVEMAVDGGAVVLAKNFGMTINGRASQFFEAGTVFDAVDDKEIVHALVKAGAKFEEGSAPAAAE